MRAIFIDGPQSVRVESIADPTPPGSDGAVIAVTASAICGSDLHYYDGDFDVTSPLAIGHETVGRVVEIGPDVRRFSVGDRVMVASVTGCGRCSGCLTGDPVMCIHGSKTFGSGRGLAGGQADLLAVPSADFQLRLIPDEVDDEAALLLTDNLVTGWAGAQRADIPSGGTVVVIGLGAVGQCAVRSALLQGAAQVLAVDPVAGRRKRAEASGAVPVEGPTVAAVMEATGGRGADSVIDAVALDATLDAALMCVRPGGTVSVIGVHSYQPYPLSMVVGLVRSITLRMTMAPVQLAWQQTVPLVQHGRLDTSGIFTQSFSLDDAAAAYALVAARSAACIKVALRP